MRPEVLARLLDDALADLRRLTEPRTRTHPVTAELETTPRLLAVIADVRDWAGLGYPSGSGGGVRGGSDTPLPERLAQALADGALADQAQADLTQAEMFLKLVADNLRWLTAFVARNTPLEHEKRFPRPTSSCYDCGRTILHAFDDKAKRQDYPASSRCRYSKDEPEVGCYGAWERRRKAQQRARDVAEQVEGVRWS